MSKLRIQIARNLIVMKLAEYDFRKIKYLEEIRSTTKPANK